jgi:hypothetical protein
MLSDLAAPLHERGIDVVAGEAARFSVRRRPRIAMLAGMPDLRPVTFKWHSSMEVLNRVTFVTPRLQSAEARIAPTKHHNRQELKP